MFDTNKALEKLDKIADANDMHESDFLELSDLRSVLLAGQTDEPEQIQHCVNELSNVHNRMDKLEQRIARIEAEEIMCTCPDHKEPHKRHIPPVTDEKPSECEHEKKLEDELFTLLMINPISYHIQHNKELCEQLAKWIACRVTTERK